MVNNRYLMFLYVIRGILNAVLFGLFELVVKKSNERQEGPNFSRRKKRIRKRCPIIRVSECPSKVLTDLLSFCAVTFY